jgi:hypothetical protein
VLLPSPRPSRLRGTAILAAETTVELERRAVAALTLTGTSAPAADESTGHADAGRSDAAVSDRPADEEAPRSLHGS